MLVREFFLTKGENKLDKGSKIMLDVERNAYRKHDVRVFKL
ncbi:MAG: hypothetical protein Q8934_10745 [Bacillota bacterium]|nr:hypothetical protein [Bacillota bacterium]